VDEHSPDCMFRKPPRFKTKATGSFFLHGLMAIVVIFGGKPDTPR
jgi:hypothetical protein